MDPHKRNRTPKNLSVGSDATGNVMMTGGIVSTEDRLTIGTMNGNGKWFQTGGITRAGNVQLGEKGGHGTMHILDHGMLYVQGPLVVGDNSGSGTLTVTGKVNTAHLELSLGENLKGSTVTLGEGGLITTNAVSAHHPDDTLEINGGTLQAKSNQARFVSGFSFGRFLLGPKGAIIDTNGLLLELNRT